MRLNHGGATSMDGVSQQPRLRAWHALLDKAGSIVLRLVIMESKIASQSLKAVARTCQSSLN